MKCVVCRQRLADTGVLCDACSDALDNSSAISPEQIEVRGARSTPAALVDVWGQPHHLDAKTSVGRSIEADKIVVLDPSVSRRHAELTLATTWTVRDLGSMVGTFVNEQKVTQPTEVHHSDRIRFGDIVMFFVDSAPRLDHRLDIPTYRLPKQQEGLPELAMSLQVPSGGGGAFAVIDHKRMQLTTPQYELLDMLAQRMRTDTNKPTEARGFVALTELTRLSLDVPDPGEQHVRQLVFRVRRALINAGVGDLIEVRRGVGYRLRVVPKA
ncbi:MAG TPA: FHA domain-containing protein [Kofleriaceae bacterium]